MKKNKNLSIIIPVFNEEQVIADVVQGVHNVFKGKRLNYEIIVVDDGSTDDTYNIAKGMKARVIRHPYNIGNGAAVKTGIRSAKGDILIMMDGDGQHNPKHIPQMLRFIPAYDMVVGARTNKSENTTYRTLANKVYNWSASYFIGKKILDLTSGFRIIKRTIAKKFVHLLPDTFSYSSTLTLTLFKMGYSIKYIPIKTVNRIGKSKISVLKDGPVFILLMLKIATLFSPFKIFLPVSIMFFLLGIGYGTYTIVWLYRFTNISQILIIIGIIIFMIGLVIQKIVSLRTGKNTML